MDWRTKRWSLITQDNLGSEWQSWHWNLDVSNIKANVLSIPFKINRKQLLLLTFSFTFYFFLFISLHFGSFSGQPLWLTKATLSVLEIPSNDMASGFYPSLLFPWSSQRFPLISLQSHLLQPLLSPVTDSQKFHCSNLMHHYTCAEVISSERSALALPLSCCDRSVPAVAWFPVLPTLHKSIFSSCMSLRRSLISSSKS